MLIQIAENIAAAQAKQKRAFDHKMAKGVKAFTFKEGDLVLRRNMVKLGRKGIANCFFQSQHGK